MSHDLANQLSQMMLETNHSLGHRIAESLGGATTAILIYLGTAGGQFALIFDPSTWTMATIASFCSIPAAIMYFLAKRAEYKFIKQQAKLLEDSKHGNAGN
jgi:divalent metal cation (Fe/Co/Zn/Cd) transporter